MKTVNTVCGPISTEELGSTLTHEHLFATSMGLALSYPNIAMPDGYENTKKYVAEKLKAAKAGGIDTIVEATPVSLGRDVRALKEVSEASGVNVIATSGWWNMAPPFAGPVNEREDLWAQGFIDDLTKGCDGTDIKAGILKAAMDKEGPTKWNKVVHHAVAYAQIETGAKILLHTYCPTETPRHQLKFLKEAGADMNKVSVGHIPETTDMDFIRWIYDQGVWMGFDRLPILLLEGEYAVATDTRIKLLKQMLDEGMGDRMLIAHDISAYSTLFNNQSPEEMERLSKICPDDFLFIKNHVFAKLADMGIDPDYLWKLTIDNPRRYFEA